MVERLGPDMAEHAKAVVAAAFQRHPMYPESMPDETADACTRFLFDTVWTEGSASLHGVRSDGELACVALCSDYHADVTGLGLLRFFWRGMRLLGPVKLIQLLQLETNKPKLVDRHLELMFLATRPGAQGQGLGREILKGLYAFAAENDYAGIALEAVKDTPPYRFYLKEGFAVGAEGTLWGQPICFMRRDV